MTFPSSQISETLIDQSSFRDNTGFVFYRDGQVYRAINKQGLADYHMLMVSGLHQDLVSKKLLVDHASGVEETLKNSFPDHLIIAPRKIPFISYPYEWCFSQLKSAALLTLLVQKTALKFGMSLKDASSYNVQFIGAEPMFIDTLSFEKYEEGQPWIAYRQFCQHFLAPLAVMRYKGHEFLKLTQLYIDGLPLNITSSLMPLRSYLKFVITAHIHFHSKMQSRHSGSFSTRHGKSIQMSRSKLLALIEHLEDGIRSLNLKSRKSQWSNYALENNYSNAATASKTEIVEAWVKKIRPGLVLDCGCNTGKFSEITAKNSDYVVGLDSDAQCIGSIYNRVTEKSVGNILPLVFDLANPSPAIGWANRERKEIFDRGTADLILALALVHHLRIANNVPWLHIAQLFKKWLNPEKWLIIEFIEKDDSQVQRLLLSRKNIFADYNLGEFLNSFSSFFTVIEKTQLPESKRWLCLLKAKK